MSYGTCLIGGSLEALRGLHNVPHASEASEARSCTNFTGSLRDTVALLDIAFERQLLNFSLLTSRAEPALKHGPPAPGPPLSLAAAATVLVAGARAKRPISKDGGRKAGGSERMPSSCGFLCADFP